MKLVTLHSMVDGKTGRVRAVLTMITKCYL